MFELPGLFKDIVSDRGVQFTLFCLASFLQEALHKYQSALRLPAPVKLVNGEWLNQEIERILGVYCFNNQQD